MHVPPPQRGLVGHSCAQPNTVADCRTRASRQIALLGFCPGGLACLPLLFGIAVLAFNLVCRFFACLIYLWPNGLFCSFERLIVRELVCVCDARGPRTSLKIY